MRRSAAIRASISSIFAAIRTRRASEGAAERRAVRRCSAISASVKPTAWASLIAPTKRSVSTFTPARLAWHTGSKRPLSPVSEREGANGPPSAARRQGETMIRHAASAAAALAFAALVVPTAADATGSYPGETLALSAPATVTAGQAVTLTASGSQTDVDSYAGGFDLEVFAKDPSVDPTCASSFMGEMTTYLTESSTEQRIVIGLWQGPDTSFDLPVKVVFDHSGPVLLCAYSDWVTDTAAAAQLTV